MIAARRLGIVSVAFVLSTHLLYAQPGPRYRDFQLGGDLASVSALAGMTAADAKIMNKFRKLGFIEYNGELKINNSLLSVVLRD